MPGDRLALAVGVGGEDELGGALDRLGDVAEPLLRLGVDLPDHLEVGVRIDRSVLGGQVADMAERRQHLVAAAEILVDRFGLSRRLDDDYVHDRPLVFADSPDRFEDESAPGVAGKMGKSPPRVKSLPVTG